MKLHQMEVIFGQTHNSYSRLVQFECFRHKSSALYILPDYNAGGEFYMPCYC